MTPTETSDIIIYMSETPVQTRKKIRRPGAGRTKGSFSFVLVSPADLAKLNPNPDFKWLVSRKQIEALGGTGFQTDLAGSLKEATAGTSEETKPEIKSEEF